MKKQKWFFVVNALAVLCTPLAQILVNTNHLLSINVADATETSYTIRLDSTNTPEFLNEVPLESGHLAMPSRSVQWVYGQG